MTNPAASRQASRHCAGSLTKGSSHRSRSSWLSHAYRVRSSLGHGSFHAMHIARCLAKAGNGGGEIITGQRRNSYRHGCLATCQTGYSPLAEAVSFHFLGKTLADEPATDNKPDLDTGQEGIEQNTFYRFSRSLITVLLTVPYSRSASLSVGAPFAALSSRTLVSPFFWVIKLDVIETSLFKRTSIVSKFAFLPTRRA